MSVYIAEDEWKFNIVSPYLEWILNLGECYGQMAKLTDWWKVCQTQHDIFLTHDSVVPFFLGGETEGPKPKKKQKLRKSFRASLGDSKNMGKEQT